MARRRDEDEYDEDEFEEYEDDDFDEYEEEYEGTSFLDRFAAASWRRVVLIPLILILFGFGAWSLWKKYRDEVLNHPAYALDPQTIQFTDPPEWVGVDIRSEVIRDGSLEQKKIHQHGLASQVAIAFEHHAWVKRVDRVRIAYPAKLNVELSYREPVAMVVLPERFTVEGFGGVYPVDADGVFLPPEGFSAEFAVTFPRIDVGDTMPSGPAGTGWGDESVSDAAKIAEVLYSEWESLKEVLFQVELSNQPFAMSEHAEFIIRGRPDMGPTPPGLLIRWGRAPGKEQTGEPTAKAKLAKLKQFVEEARASDRLPIGDIDLRSLRALQASKRGLKGTFIR